MALIQFNNFLVEESANWNFSDCEPKKTNLLLVLPGVTPVVVYLLLDLPRVLHHHDYHEQTVWQKPSQELQ